MQCGVLKEMSWEGDISRCGPLAVWISEERGRPPPCLALLHNVADLYRQWIMGNARSPTPSLDWFGVSRKMLLEGTLSYTDKYLANSYLYSRIICTSPELNLWDNFSAFFFFLASLVGFISEFPSVNVRCLWNISTFKRIMHDRLPHSLTHLPIHPPTHSLTQLNTHIIHRLASGPGPEPGPTPPPSVWSANTTHSLP